LGRLSLVIADYDAEYIRNLEKYIIARYPKRFDIASFSSCEPLYAFLDNQPHTDILLINGMMINERIKAGDTGTVIILSERDEKDAPYGYETISKYQHADKLVAEMLRLCTAKSVTDFSISGNKPAITVSVVSPAGGTGKSCIAAGCSIISAGRGKKTFYLNLEDVPSTTAFFNGDTDENFSKVIYHLKGSNNLWLRLEAAKCTDIRTGVHFFRPPENICEMDELEDEDVVRLLKAFKSSSVYDCVFIDLPAGLNRRNHTVMRYSDVIVLVLTENNAVMRTKTEQFDNFMDVSERIFMTDIKGKLLPVLNFCAGTRYGNTVFGYEPAAVIPDCTDLTHDNTASAPVNNVSFVSSLNSIIDSIFSDETSAAAPKDGGESVA